MRRVERAVCATGGCGHQRLEGPAEHLRIDGGVGDDGGRLARGEAVAREQAADHVGDRVVREPQLAVPTLERAAREETAVEEGYATEGPGGCGPRAHRGVECAEEQRFEEPAVQAASAGAPLHVMPQEGAVAVQPALGFEEGEEQQPRRGKQCQGPTIHGIGTPHRRRGELCDAAFEVAVETSRERVATQRLAPSEVHQRRLPIGRRDECRHGLGVAGADLRAVHAQDGQRARVIDRRRRDREMRAIGEEQQPAAVGEAPREASREIAREARQRVLVQRGGADDEQRPPRVGTGRDVPRPGIGEARRVAQGASLTGGQRHGGAEAERGGDCRERGIGREQLCGITRGEHGRSIASDPSSACIKSSRTASPTCAPRHRRRRSSATSGPAAPLPAGRGRTVPRAPPP